MERTQVEKRIAKIERLLGQAQEEVARLRQELEVPVSAEERWARMMLGVLEDIEERGGSVPRAEVLSIGEHHGYSRRGMAGFYQGMLLLESGVARLTDAGHGRMEALRKNYGGVDQQDNKGGDKP